MNNWRCQFQQELIDNRPHFIMGGRQSGKTIRLIKEASKTNGVIVCPTQHMVDYIFQSRLHTINCLCTLTTQIRTLTTLTNME